MIIAAWDNDENSIIPVITFTGQIYCIKSIIKSASHMIMWCKFAVTSISATSSPKANFHITCYVTCCLSKFLAILFVFLLCHIMQQNISMTVKRATLRDAAFTIRVIKLPSNFRCLSGDLRNKISRYRSWILDSTSQSSQEACSN